MRNAGARHRSSNHYILRFPLFPAVLSFECAYLAGLLLILSRVVLGGLLGVVRDGPLALAELLGRSLGSRHFGWWFG